MIASSSSSHASDRVNSVLRRNIICSLITNVCLPNRFDMKSKTTYYNLLYVVFENEDLQRYCFINIALCL